MPFPFRLRGGVAQKSRVEALVRLPATLAVLALGQVHGFGERLEIGEPQALRIPESRIIPPAVPVINFDFADGQNRAGLA